jgi:hypothetical protein
MTWNYRIIKLDQTKRGYFAVHEVFYNDKGKITNWTEHPIDITGESKVEIKRILKQMTLDVETPVLIESELPKKSK